MIETTLNVFDAAVVGVMGLSCVLAFFRGFVREVFAIAGWVIAAVAAFAFARQAEPLVKQIPVLDKFLGDSCELSIIAAFAAVFAGALLGFLRFNFPPATIYLGDAGSMLIGLVLGVLAVSAAAATPLPAFAQVTTAEVVATYAAIAEAGFAHTVIKVGGGTRRPAEPAFAWVNTVLGNVKSAITGTCRARGAPRRRACGPRGNPRGPCGRRACIVRGDAR